MHPAAAQSLLAYRPSKVVPFFAISVGLHVAAIALGLVVSWLVAAPLKLVDGSGTPARVFAILPSDG